MLGEENGVMGDAGVAGRDGSGDASGQGQDVEVTLKLEVDNPEEDFAAVHKVFAQEMVHLREKIIDYAMRDDDGSLCEKNVGNLRLVDKSWLVTVSKVLSRNHEPLYKLILDKDRALNGTQLEEEVPENLLDEFVTAVASRIEQPFPTIQVRVLEEYFRFQNRKSFHNFLMQCGQGIVELHLKIPRNAGSLPCIFANVQLPVLREMTVEFTDKSLEDPQRNGDSMFKTNSSNVAFLLHSLLNHNRALQKLEFLFTRKWDVIPMGLQYIPLPSSLTELNLGCRIEDNQIELLATSSLPNLIKLKLLIPDTTYPEGLLTRIVVNLGKTLRHFETNGVQYSGPPREINLISFPLMIQLENLHTWSMTWELESDIIDAEHYFPKLNNLTLNYQTRNMFHKWTSGSPLTHVESLELLLVNEDIIEQGNPGFILPIILEDMQRVNGTFPNVISLTLSLTGEQTCGLKYLFMEMQKLEYLEITVYECELIENSDLWDSILIGAPAGFVAGMRMHPEFLEHVKFEMKDVPSIRMLTELETFSLISEATDTEQPLADETPSLISDLSFDFAFNKMPNLKNLYLNGAFRASEATTEAWKNEGRELFYTA